MDFEEVKSYFMALGISFPYSEADTAVINEFAIGLSALKEMGVNIEGYAGFYSAVILNTEFADNLICAFGALKEIGATCKEHQALYWCAIRSIRHADKLTAGFTALKEIDATLKDDKSLYEAVIQCAEHADKLSIGFRALREVGATLEDDRSLYQRMIYSAEYAYKSSIGFRVLGDIGASLKEHPALYCKVIENANYADTLAIGFSALGELGANHHDHPMLYQVVVERANYADKLTWVFSILKENGATLKDHSDFYWSLIYRVKDADKQVIGIGLLKATGATVKSHPALYLAVIRNVRYADQFPGLFDFLKAIGATVESHPEIFVAVIEHFEAAHHLPGLFDILKAIGATLEDHLALYLAVIENSWCSDNVSLGLNALKNLDIRLPEDEEICDLVIQNITDYDLHRRLKKMYSLGFHSSTALDASNYKEMVKQALISASTMLVLSFLEENKLNLDSHAFVYEACFVGEHALVCSPYRLSNVSLRFKKYFESHPLCQKGEAGYEAQNKALQDIIDAVQVEESIITEGPLYKAQETKQLERILARIISTDGIESLNLRFDESLGYVLQFGDEPEIYLTELLRLVNFYHIQLSTEQINALGEKIGLISPDFTGEEISPPINRIVGALADAARRALMYYSGNSYYRNINCLFRGVAQYEDERYTWLSPVTGKKNLLANFLVGCLINLAAAELERLLVSNEEHLILRKVAQRIAIKRCDDGAETITEMMIVSKMKVSEESYKEVLSDAQDAGFIREDEHGKIGSLHGELDTLLPTYGLLDRSEDFKKAEARGEIGTIESRLANPVITQAVTSLSVHKGGSCFFQDPDAVRTKFESQGVSSLVEISKAEGEVIKPHGQSFLYTQNPKGGFFAREVSSPAIVSCGDGWSSAALAEAYREYLQKPYKGSSHQTTVDGKTIQRPNHGLAHVYRVMTFINVVISYFAHHAQNERFKLFCQYIPAEERQWLRVAAAFSITGRESEISAGEDLTLYDSYRIASAEHMAVFLAKYPPLNDDESMRERMLHIIRWMGNPVYEKPAAGDEGVINLHEDPLEREHRNFIHRILTIAHKLDLLRCYRPEQFNRAMENCRALSETSDTQQANYTQMLQYAIDVIRAHGNTLASNLSPSGELIACHESYRSPFDLVSCSLGRLRAMTSTVRRPPWGDKQPYQFPGCEDEEVHNQVLSICGIVRSSEPKP